jgi:prepilin signal peptidase PulO-like enzyme (type II secretory pathway)
MVIALLVVYGLCFGSFVNALVWRVYAQSDLKLKKKLLSDKGNHVDLSIFKGRSVCPNCRHRLSPIDLVPVLSWIELGGKCRYCKNSISIQYPIVELITCFLIVFSYIEWPKAMTGSQIAIFIIWMFTTVGLVALSVYDIKWKLLPNRILYPTAALAMAMATIVVISSSGPLKALLNVVGASLVGGGIFYVLFQVSAGRWIGGGDVKLGAVLGLVVGKAENSLLFIFLASIIGSVISIPLLIGGNLKRNSSIPFGPLLIAGAYIAMLFGTNIINWYTRTLAR